MRYCQSCILPDTRPNLTLNDAGICNACEAHSSKQDIDWQARELAFRVVVKRAKSRSQGYDCLIPVSGGKDSTWQVIKCLEYGLNPLAVTWKTPARTVIGQRNLDNLVSLGVDHIDYQINPKVERKFLYQSFKRFGSTAIPMHMALFNLPLKIAAKFLIPLIIWGENSAFEYGGTEEERTGFKLDRAWLTKYGVTHGTTAEDWISAELSRKELAPYFGVSSEELERQGVLAIFLGYYFPWDVETSLKVAKAHGFQERPEGAKTGYYNYADIDDDFISIHHWLKWYKFGFTRLYDNLSLEIRNRRMTREEAIAIVKERGDETPDEDIAKFCQFLGISLAHFFEIAETFRNLEIWSYKEGKWMLEDFLISDWRWT
ncbi:MULTISPECIES: N-acetyl sugar amidotransferase [Spirulina sp. CCY15215]|uniref:N-acetyl sugar amidotransferase n=1 Tax=Spirulina sp. CCY15215 TaxID=2767591 RepID=UPI001951778A